MMKSQRSWVFAALIGIIILVLILPVNAANSSIDAGVKNQFLYQGQLVDERETGPGLAPAHWAVNANTPDPTVASTSITVPAMNWVYGCSATSATMLFGYYDRNGYPKMYTGPTNSGVFPLTNAAWGTGECPLTASHKGKDGRTTKGHVDDYWYATDSTADPYYSHWTQHSPLDSIGDYMGTNQYKKWHNTDGSTTFYFNSNGAPLYDYTGSESASPAKRDGAHGMKLFAQYKGYTVPTNGVYNQYINPYKSNGFTYAQYKAEINAGRPVLIQVTGHTMLGVGYSGTNQVILHDTWDYSDHTMTWGGYYAGRQHYGVTVFHLNPATTTAQIHGKVSNSVTGAAVPGATVSIKGRTTTSDSSGNYIISGLTPSSGNTLTATKTGYYKYTKTGITLAANKNLLSNIPITPVASTGVYRIVLTWNAEPRDLDSHLITPLISGSTYHIYYSNRGSLTSLPYAHLDQDARYGYGPETVTIQKHYAGTYKYYVYQYAGTGTLSSSKAKVLVYRGSSLLKTYNVPTTGSGYYWRVFNLNGGTGAITTINTISTGPQGLSPGEVSAAADTEVKKSSTDSADQQFALPPGL